MILSRSSVLLRLHDFAGRSLLQNRLHKTLESSRGAHGSSWAYRQHQEMDPRGKRLLEVIGGFFWWWVTWHFITDYEELLPHPFPDPSKWTDEELGVPPIEG